MSACPDSQLPRLERAVGGHSLHPVHGGGGSVLSPPHTRPSAGSSTPLPGPSLDHELERQSPTQVPGILASVVSTPSPMSGGQAHLRAPSVGGNGRPLHLPKHLGDQQCLPDQSHLGLQLWGCLLC